jgi:hypothetical protein
MEKGNGYDEQQETITVTYGFTVSGIDGCLRKCGRR